MSTTFTVIAFKTLIGGLYLFWLISVVLMTQKAMARKRMDISEAGMLWVKALFVVLFVVIILNLV